MNYHVASVYLSKSKQYKLLLGNSTATAANYDISLKTILANGAPIATIGKIVSLQKPTATAPPKDNSKKLIWIVIAIAAVVLTFFTYRLVTDMNKSKS